VVRNGRILVVQSGGYGQTSPHVIRRLNPDGSPDQTFGTGGSIQPDFGAPQGTFLSDVIPDRAGRLIVVGAIGSGPATRFLVRRYLADGSRDTAFGETILEGGDPVSSAKGRLTSDGGVLLTFPVGRYPTLVHLSADGTLDRSFIGGGRAPMPFAVPRWQARVEFPWRGRPIVLPDGRIRIPIAFDMPQEEKYRIALVGLKPDGRPDRRFGFRGLALGPLPALPGGERPDAAVSDSTGSVIVAGNLAGEANETGLNQLGGIIRRFRPDGSLDRSFGKDGLVPAALPALGNTVIRPSLALLGPDLLVAGEYTVDGKYGFWGSTALRTLNAGHDRDRPKLRVKVRGCRSVLVRIADASEVESVARIGDRVVRRTTRKRFRLRSRQGGRRVSVWATDLAENVARKRVRLPRC
jgi:uncharacterized delta-60 repeat protein